MKINKYSIKEILLGSGKGIVMIVTFIPLAVCWLIVGTYNRALNGLVGYTI